MRGLGRWEICALPRCTVYYNGGHPPRLKVGSVQCRSLLESAIERGLVDAAGARELLEELVGELERDGTSL